MPASSIVPPERLADINTALQRITLALQEVDLATRAGIDVSAQKQQLLDSQSKLLQIKNVYFPGQ